MKAKQIISVTLAALLMLGALALPSLAAEPFTVTVGTLDKSVGVVPGDEIVVPVYITGNPGVYSYVFNYFYDATKLECQKDKMNNNLGKGDYTCLINDFTLNDKGGEIVSVSLYGKRYDQTENGVIIYLMFKVKESAKGGFSPITVSYKTGNVCNYNIQKLFPEKVAGGVYIDGPIEEEKVSSEVSTTSGGQATPSLNPDGKPKGYVPMETVPSTAAAYYKNAAVKKPTASGETEKPTGSETVTSSGTVSSNETQSSEAEISSNADTPQEETQKTGMKRETLYIILAICAAALAAVGIIATVKKNKEN